MIFFQILFFHFIDFLFFSNDQLLIDAVSLLRSIQNDVIFHENQYYLFRHLLNATIPKEGTEPIFKQDSNLIKIIFKRSKKNMDV